MKNCYFCSASNKDENVICSRCGKVLVPKGALMNTTSLGVKEQKLLMKKNIISAWLLVLVGICCALIPLLLHVVDPDSYTDNALDFVDIVLITVGAISVLIAVFNFVYMGRILSKIRKSPALTYANVFERFGYTIVAYEDGKAKGFVDKRYESLVAVRETKDYFLIYESVTAVLMVSKSGFEVGTAEEFRELMKKSLSKTVCKLK